MNDSGSKSGMHIAVIGGGVIGMCCALSLSDRGAEVTLLERGQPGRGASWAAAGMLAPAFEAAAESHAHPRLFDLCMEGARHWQSFAPRLRELTDRSLDYGHAGALACAATPEQGELLMKLAQACADRGVPHSCLEADEALNLEPNLSSDLIAALELPTDQQVDNWAVIDALQAALKRAGVQVLGGSDVSSIDGDPGELRVDTAPDRTFDRILWTTGQKASASILYNGTASHIAPAGAVIPVKGQMFSLAPTKHSPRRVLRFGSGYVAPKPSRIVVGATVEWGVDDEQAELQVIDTLRQQAAQVCPSLADGEITHIWAGVRPGTADHAPIFGASRLPGVYIATGHYRNGILLAPLTGEIMADLLLNGTRTVLAAAFSPERFATSAQS